MQLKRVQKLNANLYHLWCALCDLERCNYGSDVNDRLRKFIYYVEGKTFRKLPENFDITKQEHILISYLEN